MGNAVRRQGEGLCGGREVPPPRVARTGLGAGLWRAGRAPEGADPEPEGAGQGRAGRAPEGAGQRGGASAGGGGSGEGGARSAACAGRGGGGRRWRERAVWRVGGLAGSGWSGLFDDQDPRSTRLAC